MILQRDVTPQAFVWLLGAASQLHRIPFDPRLVLQQFPPPHTVASLQAALEGLGFRSALEPRSPEAFTDLAFPCFALIQPPPVEGPTDPVPVAPAPLTLVSTVAQEEGVEPPTAPAPPSPDLPPLGFSLLLKAEAG
ncbi:MAG: hypothetical protein EG824_00510, partial [Deltaproteobacteria bacterium]|nr:hypothetical protein [Deltaproteobacteria bacterium]